MLFVAAIIYYKTLRKKVRKGFGGGSRGGPKPLKNCACMSETNCGDEETVITQHSRGSVSVQGFLPQSRVDNKEKRVSLRNVTIQLRFDALTCYMFANIIQAGQVM